MPARNWLDGVYGKQEGTSYTWLNGENVYVNNANLNNSTESVYAVIGMCSAESADKGEVSTTIEKINLIEKNSPQDNIYAWDQKEGQKASSTGTIYGVYDMSGGTWERVTGLFAFTRSGGNAGYHIGFRAVLCAQ